MSVEGVNIILDAAAIRERRIKEDSIKPKRRMKPLVYEYNQKEEEADNCIKNVIEDAAPHYCHDMEILNWDAYFKNNNN